MVLVVAIAACSQGNVSTSSPAAPTLASLPTGQSPAPSTSPLPSATTAAPPTAKPSTPVGTLDVIPPGAAIEVTVAELNLRLEPSTSAGKVETLKKGDILVTAPYDALNTGIGPKKANGYTWYPVVRLQVAGPDGGLPPLPTRPIILGTEVVGGWIAANNGSKSFVAQLPPRCPSTVDLENVQAMLSAELLACFGEAFTLQGTYGCGGCGGTSSIVGKPVWLADPFGSSFLSVDPSKQVGPLGVHFSPKGPAAPAEGSIIRATVHVDDPAAAKCSIQDISLPDGDPDRAFPAAGVVLYCRERVVVESFDVLGTDPSFPG
jgi:hypothetical protein